MNEDIKALLTTTAKKMGGGMQKGDFIRIKEEYAFDVPSKYHFGEVVEINVDTFGGDEIRLKCDLRYSHDSFKWVDESMYEKVINN